MRRRGTTGTFRSATCRPEPTRSMSGTSGAVSRPPRLPWPPAALEGLGTSSTPADTSTSSTRTSSARTTRMAISTEGPSDSQSTGVGPDTYAPLDLGATTPLPRAAAETPQPSASPVPPAPTRIRGLGLGWKIFFAVAVTVGLVLVATLAVVQQQSSKAAETSIHNGRLQTAKLIESLLSEEADALSAKSHIYVEAPGGIRTVIEQTGDTSPPKAPAPAPTRGGRKAAAAPAPVVIDS